MFKFLLQNPCCWLLLLGLVVFMHPEKITFKAFWVERIMSVYCEEEGKAKICRDYIISLRNWLWKVHWGTTCFSSVPQIYIVFLLCGRYFGSHLPSPLWKINIQTNWPLTLFVGYPFEFTKVWDILRLSAKDNRDIGPCFITQYATLELWYALSGSVLAS